MPRCWTVSFKTLTTFAASTALVLLAGCSSLSPYSTLTKVNLKLATNDQLNTDINGRPSPIVVRLFELKHPATFETTDFFSLYGRAQEVLGADMVAREELELRPGETVQFKLRVNADSGYIGVLAAYRDLPDTKWRYTVQISPAAVTDVDLMLDQTGVRNSRDPLTKADD